MDIQVKRPFDVLRDADGFARYVITAASQNEVVVVAKNHPEDSEDGMIQRAQLEALRIAAGL